jgi:hypothetical protein
MLIGKTTKVNTDHLLGLAVCLLLVIGRTWQRLYYPDLWAEDGKIFLTDGLREGAASLFSPYAGSYHTIQRLVALSCIRFIPAFYWPFCITLFCLLIFVWVAALSTRREYEWLLPTRTSRLGVAILFCLTPGLKEMMGNLANLNWILFLWLALIGLKDLKSRISTAELVIGMATLLSVGTSILLIPLFTWRLWYNRRDRRLMLLWATIIAINMWLILLNQSVDQPHHVVSPMVALGLLNTFIKSVILRPWLGVGLASHFSGWGESSVGLRLLAFTGLAALTAWFFKHRRELNVQALAVFTVSMFAWPILRYFGRPGSMEVPMFLDPNYFSLRFSFPLGVTAILVWMSLFSLSAKTRFVSIFLFLNLLFGLDRFFIHAYEYGSTNFPHERLWTRQAPILEEAMRTGTPSKVKIQIYPLWGRQWCVEYSARDS